MVNPYRQYKENYISTASPAQLVVMLYDDAIKFIKQGIEHIKEKDYEAKQKKLNKALDIIYELLSTLNVKEGGQIATNLQSLYLYIIRRINDGSFKLDIAALEEVISLLDNINESWRQLARQEQSAGSGTAYSVESSASKSNYSGKI